MLGGSGSALDSLSGPAKENVEGSWSALDSLSGSAEETVGGSERELE